MREMGGMQPISVHGTRIESIPFSVLPGQSQLFLDYLADPVSLSNYFPAEVAVFSDLEGRVREVLDAHRTDRDKLCTALRIMNARFGASAETLANIELLRRGDTVAVMTGQQTGFLSGPLFTIYKAVSAIRAAERLRTRDISAVPVFWMATEDHDLDEVSTAFVLGQNDDLVSLSIKPASEEIGKPVGSVILNESVEAALSDLFASVPRTEFTSALRSELSAIWRQGADLATSFGATLSFLVGKYGLVVVDPRDLTLKRLAAPVYLAAIERSQEIVDSLIGRSADLINDGYHAQVQISQDHFPLFWHDDDGKRNSLRRAVDGTLRPKGSRNGFTLSDMLSIAENTPERFSPGVMLRPVVQDFLFPTICYFGGAAEVSYFAQNSEVYRVMERPVTPILHRQSFTVVESRHFRTLDKYGIGFNDLFEGEDVLLRTIVEKFIDPTTTSLFDEVEVLVGEELDRLGERLAGFDAPLAANLNNRKRKISYHLSALRKKFQKRRSETDETIARRVRAALGSLAPKGMLQERSVNIFTYFDRLGPAFIDIVHDSVDLEDKGHRVIYL